jgi:predicted HTH domain antitoxin
MQTTCNVIIKFQDDFGDNLCTFHCALPEGHVGDHEESGELFNHPYRPTWQGSTTKEGQIEFALSEYQAKRASIGHAAELAGLSVREIIEEAVKRRIKPHWDEQTIREELGE